MVGSRLVRLGELLRRSRLDATREAEAALAGSPALAARMVLDGPFRGMRYPAPRAFGSMLYPKLVGSYECELHPWLEQLRRRPYAHVMDIGCAEGYYAVGLALLWPAAQVHAHDSDPAALDACRETARANGVLDRLHLGGAVSAEDLGRFGALADGLIVCDCEGCELSLFTPPVVERLAGCDVIVELHDFIDPTISSTLVERFRPSHAVHTVRTARRHPGRFAALRGLSPLARELAMAEQRPGPMEWLLARSRPGARTPG